MPASDAAAPSASSRPLTGAEFLESLRGTREVWIHGERVEDVTAHPAFRNPARMLARLYDALHAPATQSALTCRTPPTSARRRSGRIWTGTCAAPTAPMPSRASSS